MTGVGSQLHKYICECVCVCVCLCVCVLLSVGLDNKLHKMRGAYITICHSDEFSTYRAFDTAPLVKGAEKPADRTVNL
jgi:hypothetical protein